MVIAGLSHHTWWAILAGAINVWAVIAYLLRRIPAGVKVLIANTLMGLFGGICLASLVIAGLLDRNSFFAVSCVRGNGLAFLMNLIARLALRRSLRQE